MKENKNNVYTILDTRDYPTYEDYVQDCEENGNEVYEEDSREYWHWVSDMTQMDLEDALSNIEYSPDAKCPCIVTGTLGLWNGRPTIHPTRCESLRKAVEKCMRSGDDAKVTYDNGVIKVEVYHHDGTNYFEIRKLSKRGLSVTDNWYSDAVECEVKSYWTAKVASVY